jgi:hypothetical protein
VECQEVVDIEAEAGVEFAAAEAGDEESAAVEFAGEPFAGKREREKGGSERAADMGTALAPVETSVGETASLGASGFEVEAEGGECAGSFGGEVVGDEGGSGETGGGGAGRRGAAEGLDPARAKEAVVEGDGDGSGHVVVAGACGAKMLGGAGNEGAASATGEDAEALKGAGDVGRSERVVAMASLDLDADKVLRFEAVEVDAGGGGGNFRDDGEFGAGAGVAVHEAVEHASAGGLADGGGDGGDGVIDALGSDGCGVGCRA